MKYIKLLIIAIPFILLSCSKGGDSSSSTPTPTPTPNTTDVN
jgi:cellulase/cellobiase CelA1